MPLAELDDVSIYYKEHGSGPPVLGIMGFAADSRLWAAQIPALAASYRFIAFDNRGAGRSGGKAASIEVMADDAVRLLDHLGIEKTAVFGISMGGAIAQRVVLKHPDRVSALILALTFARPLEFQRRLQAWSRAIVDRLGADADPLLFVEGSLLRMFTPSFFEIGKEAVDRIVAAYLASSNGPMLPGQDLILGQLDALDEHDTLAELPQISCPTLVMGARMDQMVPFIASEEIAAAIPGAELAVFETGHGAPLEEAEAFNACIVDFLTRSYPAS